MLGIVRVAQTLKQTCSRSVENHDRSYEPRMSRPHQGLRRQVGLVAAIILMIVAVSSCGKSERPVRIFGLSQQGPNFGIDAAEQAAHSLERKLDVVNIFIAWEWERSLPTPTLQRISELGALPAITWEPWHPADG